MGLTVSTCTCKLSVPDRGAQDKSGNHGSTDELDLGTQNTLHTSYMSMIAVKHPGMSFVYCVHYCITCILNYSDERSLQGLVHLGMQNCGCDEYLPFPSRMFALLYILLHIPRPIVSQLAPAVQLRAPL